MSLSERHDKVPRSSDLLMLMRVSCEARAGGHEAIAALLARPEEAGPSAPRRIVARTTRQGWKSSVESVEGEPARV